MAKKSAKSKGFRKQAVKKPYLSKKDIAILCVALVALAIGAFFLFRYDDGALKVQDGAVVAEGDNWLIVNGSNVRGRARYFKLGELGEIDGFAREKGRIATDANVPQYSFSAEAEDSAVQSLTVTTSHSGAEALAKYATQMLSSMDSADVGEIQTARLGDRDVVYYIYTTAYTADEAEESEDTDAAGEASPESADAQEAPEEASDRFTRTISGYIDASHDSCVALLAESSADSADACASDEALLAALEQAAAAVTLED